MQIFDLQSTGPPPIPWNLIGAKFQDQVYVRPRSIVHTRTMRIIVQSLANGPLFKEDSSGSLNSPRLFN